MIDRLRTLSAHFFTRTGIGSVELRVRACAWLAAHTDDLLTKIHHLEHILALQPDLKWAQQAYRDMTKVLL